MENPWIHLQHANGKYFLPDDLPFIEQNNKKCKSSNDPKYMHLGYLPEPFIGNKDAGVYFLLANPGRARNDDSLINIDPKLKEVTIKNIRHEEQECRFYPLYEDFKKFGVYKWWSNCLKDLTKLGISREFLINNFFSVELYGYHSFIVNGGVLKKGNRFPSIEYNIFLVRNAIKENKLILLGRSVNNWFSLVPELRNYENCHFVANNRGMALSHTTLSPPVLRMMKDKMGLTKSTQVSYETV